MNPRSDGKGTRGHPILDGAAAARCAQRLEDGKASIQQMAREHGVHRQTMRRAILAAGWECRWRYVGPPGRKRV